MDKVDIFRHLADKELSFLAPLPPEKFKTTNMGLYDGDVIRATTEIRLGPKLSVVVQGGKPCPWNVYEDGFFSAYIQQIIEEE